MAKSGDLLDIPELGIRVRFVRTAEETAGEVAEFDCAVDGADGLVLVRGPVELGHPHAAEAELGDGQPAEISLFQHVIVVP